MGLTKASKAGGLSDESKKKKKKKKTSGSESEPTSDGTTDMTAKLKEIRRKMEQILKKQKSKWSPADIEFMKMATEPKMFTLLKSVKL
mmetsp:Transcript_2683/g.2341  ORF Transcript_2683/g.2341 Transcript_2683/m.2341 type:complete len:88 (+) Transcript_2683:1317-1580(+)|eukprot:CAMPEP_0114581656 /NCGR_PEP_ID=MMETSP0125-20121206/5743_1 /TAXON_ID=485358 ORGANISM="Aristerostoma sp., Strain ATCC 50986" /NCGR_SAMPLE_ID=MMETSP0125 /ASSEMBLY_ACC=CAM_ASM_000245 /LENGTH=87 /DNA_ID=CAMNT_0001774039 /DNA_START=2057 /DNA_END=2320 /DNA_ORIENTATION=-